MDPVGDKDHYSAVVYDNSSGLPTSVANDIAQTDDGFIWIGTNESGVALMKQDGFRW